MAKYTEAYVRNPGLTAGHQLTIADDAATSIEPERVVSIVDVFTADGVEGGRVLVSVDSGGATAKSLGKTANLNVTTGTLGGATGTDAKLTVSAHTDGKLYVENRLAAEKDVFVREHL